MWKCIDVIKKIRNLEELKREQYNVIEQPEIKKKYKNCGKRLHSLIINYNTNTNKNFVNVK
jgi:hypothetical protein